MFPETVSKGSSVRDSFSFHEVQYGMLYQHICFPVEWKEVVRFDLKLFIHLVFWIMVVRWIRTW